MTPEVTAQPPRSQEEPKLRDVRQFYVKPYDLDPVDGGRLGTLLVAPGAEQ